MVESIVRKFIKCGKAACKKCPHGPYWYKSEKINGRTKMTYIGKDHPNFRGDPDDPTPVGPLTGKGAMTDKVLFEETEAEQTWAWTILQLPCLCTRAQARKKVYNLCHTKKVTSAQIQVYWDAWKEVQRMKGWDKKTVNSGEHRRA